MNENLELREWLAVNLMGWAKRNTASERGRMFEHGLSYPTPLTHLPAYESTYDGMGAVIERMREKGYRPFLCLGRESGWCAVWHNDGVTGKGVADALPIAVALAAKAAIESETK